MLKLYSKSHEWAKIEGNVAEIGISDFAAKELGDVVYVELPEVGKSVNAGDELLELELRTRGRARKTLLRRGSGVDM